MDLLHFEASCPGFAFFCTSCSDFFICSLLFSHLLMLFEVSYVTSLNSYPLFCLMIFRSEEKTVILSLPLHNALTIHSLLPAYEATLQGNQLNISSKEGYMTPVCPDKRPARHCRSLSHSVTWLKRTHAVCCNAHKISQTNKIWY